MECDKLGFSFVGGFKNGCVVRGDSVQLAERHKVGTFAAMTNGGEIGKRIRGRRKQSNHELHEQLAEGEPIHEAANQTYEVVSHLRDEHGLVMVSCQLVDAE